ncbi:hypothetical protein STRTUCAR8_08952, partial [Streptomyces turgidiscabies Car8]
GRRFGLGPPPHQLPLPLAARGDVPDDRTDVRAAVGGRQEHHAELDGQLAAVRRQRRNVQQIGVAVLGRAPVHGFLEAVPVTLPVPLRDDDVQAATVHVARREPEDALRATVPEADQAFAVDDHYAVGRLGGHPQHHLGIQIFHVASALGQLDN